MPATPTRDRVKPETLKETPLRRPEWIKVARPCWRDLRTITNPDALKSAAHRV